jgi:hypothetical protein
MTTEELAETWRDDQSGEYIQLQEYEKRAVYIAHGRFMERIEPKYGDIWAGIRAWCKAKQFWPNIWSVNDHGNVELYSHNGTPLGGLV